jgi:hypothetical protein
MHISILCSESAPFTDSPLSAVTSGLAAQMVRNGAEVSLIMPLAVSADPAPVPLARRLNRVEVSADGATASFVRFDGRTAAGVNVLLLDGGGPSTPGLLGAAAIALLDGGGMPCDVVVVVNGAFRPVRSDGAPWRIVHVICGDGTGEVIGPDDGLLVLGRGTARRLITMGGIAGRMLADGRALVLPVATAVTVPTDFDKPSWKARCQYDWGLPVADVPLFFLGNAQWIDTDILRRLLRQDVQVVLMGTPSEILTGLADEYPDRLAQLPGGELTAVTAGCDFQLCADVQQVADCLPLQTFPLVHRDAADATVDLDPSLSSGSAVHFGDGTGRTLEGAFGEAVAAYRHRDSFALLRTRLSMLAHPWTKTATALDALLGSAV